MCFVLKLHLAVFNECVCGAAKYCFTDSRTLLVCRVLKIRLMSFKHVKAASFILDVLVFFGFIMQLFIYYPRSLLPPWGWEEVQRSLSIHHFNTSVFARSKNCLPPNKNSVILSSAACQSNSFLVFMKSKDRESSPLCGRSSHFWDFNVSKIILCSPKSSLTLRRFIMTSLKSIKPLKIYRFSMCMCCICYWQ